MIFSLLLQLYRHLGNDLYGLSMSSFRLILVLPRAFIKVHKAAVAVIHDGFDISNVFRYVTDITFNRSQYYTIRYQYAGMIKELCVQSLTAGLHA
jgi:hypothetical protein